MFPYMRSDIHKLIAMSAFCFPQVVSIWSYSQDDGFGNMISILDMCCCDLSYTNYVINYLGYDSLSSEFLPCNYGDH